jgi:hypothetical protein
MNYYTRAQLLQMQKKLKNIKSKLIKKAELLATKEVQSCPKCSKVVRGQAKSIQHNYNAQILACESRELMVSNALGDLEKEWPRDTMQTLLERVMSSFSELNVEETDTFPSLNSLEHCVQEYSRNRRVLAPDGIPLEVARGNLDRVSIWIEDKTRSV